jgi:hypothetical protein
MAYQPIEPVGLGRNVANEMMKGGPRLQQEIKTMGPDTIKMIALQQIADQEKQRAMQANMQAQPNPATVMQQVEQEVMQMAQPQQPAGMPMMRDRVPQVGGVLAQKQRMQQQNMQRAGRPQPRPQQPPVRAAMGGLMTQAAPNIHPRYFEGGGIVAFAEGDRVKGGVDPDELKRYGFTYEQFAELSPEQQQQLIMQINSIRETKLDAASRVLPRTAALGADIAAIPITALQNIVEGARTSDVGKALGLAEPFEEGKRTSYSRYGDYLKNIRDSNVGEATSAGILSQLPKPQVEEGDDGTVKVSEDRKIDVTETGDGSSGAPQVEVQEQQKETVYEQIDAPAGIEIPASLKQAGAKPSTAGIQGLLSKLSTDPNAERDSAAEFYKKQRALSPELQKKKEGIEAEIERRYNQAGGVDKRRTLREMFAAAGGTGSLGTLGSRMSGALSSAQDTAQARKDKLFGEYNESINKLVGRSDEIASGALTYGQKEKENAKQDIRAALNTASALYQSESADARAARTSEANMTIANAGNEVRTNIANLSAKVQQQTTAALNEFREASLGADDVKSQRQLVGTLAAAKQKAEAAIAASLAEITQKLAYAVPPDDFEGTPEEYREGVVQAAMRRMTDSLAPIDALLAEFGGNLGVDMSVPEPEEQGDPRADAIVGI